MRIGPLSNRIGASDAETSGDWKWLAFDQLFWSDGGPVDNAYTNWEFGHPDWLIYGDCAAKDPPIGNGYWETFCCNLKVPYVCELYDECPDDPDKTKVGLCGCGTPDTDEDGDGVPACMEECDLDPYRVTFGECGCIGAPFPRDENTPCGDSFCGDTMCDGEGSCGSPTLDSCIPTGLPPHGCEVRVHDNHAYLFCTDGLTVTEAREYCAEAGTGMELVRIDDDDEDAFVADNLSVSSWIGATDSADEGQWLWMDGDTLFWEGESSGSGGAAVDWLYANWEHTQPDADSSLDDCAIYALSGSGSPVGWDDRNCDSQYGFVCEVVNQCPTDSIKDKPGFCGCGSSEDVVIIDGREVVVCTDQCPDDPTKNAPGKCGCGIPDSLCPIECPYNLFDPNSPVYGKLQMGRCGCDTPDVDADGNGVIDCFEGESQCGTAASPEPEGTPCDDSICEQSCPVSTVCDGNGVCGDPDACAPQGGGTCVFKVFRGHVYWFCEGQLTRAEARAICGQDGAGYLVSIDDDAENEFLQANITADSWTGGNQTTAPGEWWWANRTFEEAKPFWDGGVGGEPYRNSAYANWTIGEPSGGDFAVIMAGTDPDAGKWRADSGGALAFVCEKSRPLAPYCAEEIDCLSEYFGVGPCGPTDEPCVPKEQALPTIFAGMSPEEAIQAATNCHLACEVCDENDEQCKQACEAACAANGIVPPPEGSTCEDIGDSMEIGEQCLLAEDEDGNPQWYPDPTTGDPIPCQETADCLQHGDLPTDVVCGFWRQCTVDPGSYPPDAGPPPPPCPPGSNPGTQRVCGKPSPNCLTGQSDDPERCYTTPLICEPADARQEVETIGFPEGPPTPPCPQDLFEEDPVEVPDLTVEYPTWDKPCMPESPVCANHDGSGGRGHEHPYCFYQGVMDLPVDNKIDEQYSQTRAKNQNASGSENIIDFELTPRLDLKYHAELGPLGVPDINVTAGAGLKATVQFNGDKLPFGGEPVEIVNLTAKAYADQCQVTTEGSRIRLFGHDFLPTGGSVYEPVGDCVEAFEAFKKYANRASKAMRDVASLLKQYESAQNDGKRLDLSTLCEAGKVFDDPPEDFPLPMNCADQPPESHINELINYYEQQVVALQAAGAALADNELTLYNEKVPLVGGDEKRGDEEQTLFAANFMIGPIPVTLEAFIAAHYEIGLSVGYRVQPGQAVAALLGTNVQTGKGHELLAVFVNGGPNATAFLGFFAGVGFHVGPVGAKIGIEAELTLGSINLTVEGGAGLIMTGEPDPRPLGEDLASLVPPGQDGKPQTLIDPLVYDLKLGYSAELSADIQNILSGSINAKLKLSFFFFSITYRQRLLKFNGFCTTEEEMKYFPCHIPILTLGGATTLADLPWAKVRMSQMLPKLKYLPFVPEPEPGSAPEAQPADLSQVEELFYDRLCSCVAEGDECISNGDCCDNLPCADHGTGTKTCGCREFGESCATTGDCCAELSCINGFCGIIIE
ncbi:MAG: C-type lectin domain-containing protein [Deltaproteobacteria bacterium]|nr:C-type lectin domain-containing protein [Deltaproteobacteria bacterium]